MSVFGVSLRLWRCRWALARLLLASALLWVCASDLPARLERLRLASMPDTDYASEVARLREQEHFGEALLVADAGLEASKDAARGVIERERALVVEAQSSWLRRGRDVLKGAVLGADAEASLERLIGAVGADFFVIGDVRDLAVQGVRYVRQGEADGVIVALSAIGLVTTLAPEIDWAPSVLKIARRAGAMSERLGERIVKLVKGRELRAAEAMMGDVATLSREASPAVAMRVLRLANDEKDVARLARFVERRGKGGAMALRQTGRAGADVLRSADELRLAGRVAEAERVEGLIVRAGSKGEQGAAWLKSGAYARLLRPHVLVGVGKALWSGRGEALIHRAMEALDPVGGWLLALLAGWTMLEAVVLSARLSATPDAQRGVWRRVRRTGPRA